MARSEMERLESDLEQADGSQRRLAEVFTSLEDRLGHPAASQLWWGAFGARDAAET